jgi:hypothetical protein
MVFPSVGIEIILLLVFVMALFLVNPSKLDWLWRKEGGDQEAGGTLGGGLTPGSQGQVWSERVAFWARRLVPIAFILWWLVATIQANFERAGRFPGIDSPWPGTFTALLFASLGIAAHLIFVWDDRGPEESLRGRMRMAVRGRYKHPELMDPQFVEGSQPEPPDDKPRPRRKRKFRRQL